MPHLLSSFDGTEISWLAIDDVGQVGVFATAGEGPIPESALAEDGTGCELEEQLEQLDDRSEYTLHVRYPRPDNFIAIARRGLYAFDWVDVHKTQAESEQRYRLVAQPSGPLTVHELPVSLQAIARATHLRGVIFSSAATSGVVVEA